jgi:electron transport complex protein RnfB
MLGVVVVCLLGLLLGALLGWADRLARRDDDELLESIQALLPQTQCAQCGYPGCRPYAEAIANGTDINRCPPGGESTIKGLAELLGRRPLPLARDLPSTAIGPAMGAGVETVARIDEQSCIGCALCLPACPVDAIIGAPKFMHTVIARHCTGCELCLAPCPVDCIDMQPDTPLESLRWFNR